MFWLLFWLYNFLLLLRLWNLFWLWSFWFELWNLLFGIWGSIIFRFWFFGSIFGILSLVFLSNGTLLVLFCASKDSAMFGESWMSEKKLFSLAYHIIFILLFLALLNFSCVKFQPRLYLFLLTQTGLEYLKFYLLLQSLNQDWSNILRNNFSQVFDCNFKVNVHSFLEFNDHRVFLR